MLYVVLRVCRYPSAVSGRVLVATAQSNGEVVVYSIRDTDVRDGVQVVCGCGVPESSLCLSLDWNCRAQAW